jgi:hypothetical protein
LKLEVVLAKEYKSRLRNDYWKKDFEKEPNIWGIAFSRGRCYILIDNIVKTKGWKTKRNAILAINTTCVHELIHLANIGCREISERRTKQLEKLLVLGRKGKLKNIIEID